MSDAASARTRLRWRRGRRAAAPARPRRGAARRSAAAARHDADRLRGRAAARAPRRVGGGAGAFVRAVLHRPGHRPGSRRPRRDDVEQGAAVIVVRAHHFAPTRGRLAHATAERAARAAAPGRDRGHRRAASGNTAGHVLVLAPADAEPAARRAAEAVARELQATLHGFTFAVGFSRVTLDPADLYRAGNEALLAANCRRGAARPATAGPRPPPSSRSRRRAPLGLLPAMSEDPNELQRFYSETVQDFVVRLRQAVRDRPRADPGELPRNGDSNVANTAQRLFTHRHTIPLPPRSGTRPLHLRRPLHRRAREAGARRCGCSASPRRAGPRPTPGAHGGRVPRGGRER